MTQLPLLSDGMFRALLEAAPDAMVCTAADGRVVLLNAEAERLFGYQREELIGQPVEILVPEAARGVHAEHRAGYVAEPRHRPMGENLPLAGRRRDASTFPAEISLSAIDTDEGILVAAAIRDVTAQLRVRDLERSNQSLESFIYSVSHDLRAPLRALSGYSAALLEEYGGVLGEEGRGYAERIVAVSEQMAQLIDHLLQLSRISRAELHLQPVDLGAEAAQIAEEIQRREPGRRVRFAIPGRSRPWRTAGLSARSWKICWTTPGSSPPAGTMRRSSSARRRAGTPPCAVTCGTTAPASIPPMRASCSSRSSGCMRPASSPAPASAWPACGRSWNATAAGSGPRAPSERGATFYFTLDGKESA